MFDEGAADKRWWPRFAHDTTAQLRKRECVAGILTRRWCECGAVEEVGEERGGRGLDQTGLDWTGLDSVFRVVQEPEVEWTVEG